MPAETELRDLVASRRGGVLGTIKRSGLPQLSNVLYLPGPTGARRLPGPWNLAS
jgi:hypothetical protein